MSRPERSTLMLPALKLGAVALAFAFAYRGAVSLLLNTWSNSNTYSHGVLVPFISMYFIWSRRQRLAATQVCPSVAAGGAMLLASSLVLVSGHVSSLTIVQEASILIAVPALILLLLGRRQLRELALPAAYLVFMVPVLDVVINRIQLPFQLLSARVAVGFLKHFGIPVFLNRQFIELPEITLEVAKACSGVQYLVAIGALAIPLAFITLRGRMRFVLLALAVVIGVATNWARVVFIALWSYNGGEVLHGPMHIFQGLFVAVFGFVVLFAVSMALGRFQGAAPRPGAGALRGESLGAAFATRRFTLAAVCAVAILGATGAYMALYRPGPVPLAEPLRRLPAEIAGWKGADMGGQAAAKPFHIPGADSQLHRMYADASGRRVELHVAYFESQAQGRELVHHRLKSLYEASGPVELASEGGPLRLNRAVQAAGPRTYEVVYWYDVNGGLFSNRYSVKLKTLFEGLTRRRTNGAVITVSWERDSGEPGPQGAAGHEFIRAALPAISSQLRPAQ